MAIVIYPDGNIEDVQWHGERLAELQELVGGYIELVPIDHALNGVQYTSMVVNEEGLLHQLDHNPVASEISDLFIVGPAVLISRGELK